MRHVRCGRMSLLFASVGIYTTTSFAAHRLLACWPPLPVVGLLASPASSHVSARPQPHSHERRCTVSTRLNFTHRHTSVHTTRSHSQHLFCEPAMGVWARPISLQASCSVACCWASRHNHARVARVVCCTEILIDLTSYGGVDYASSRS